jgi:hypothetical protein
MTKRTPVPSAAMAAYWAGSISASVATDVAGNVRTVVAGAPDPARNWTLVLAYTRGASRGYLSRAEARELRLRADGFGDLRGADSAENADHQDLLWDWSHVRDSSVEAVARMAAYLRGL